MLQFEELKLALDELKPDLSDLEEALDLKAAGEEIEKLEAQAAEPEFWNDMSHSQKILQRTSTLKNNAGLELSIDDAEAVQKSWPHFFEAIKPLGAEVEYA